MTIPPASIARPARAAGHIGRLGGGPQLPLLARTERVETRCWVTTQAGLDAGAEITGEQEEEELGAFVGKGK